MKHLQLRAADGHSFTTYLATPAGRPRGGVVVVQEIFGVTKHIERMADRYAEHGYLAIAPSLFDRQERRVDLPYDAEGSARGVTLARNAPTAGLMTDLDASVDVLVHTGAVAMVGYCWGGRVVFQASSRANIAAGVVYYGGGIPSLLDHKPRVPVQFHFGRRDEHIPLDDVERIRAAYPQGEYHLYPAGHGFNCPERSSYDPSAAHVAFGRSLEFFEKHLG
jgi:carboxymethylenebutenolidase